MNRLREIKVTDEQKNILIDFMEDHPDFAKGKCLGAEGKRNSAYLWNVLSTQLNNAGVMKSTTKWQKVWSDLKTKTKRKASEIKLSRRKTGGGPSTKTTLTVFEQRLLRLLRDEVVFAEPLEPLGKKRKHQNSEQSVSEFMVVGLEINKKLDKVVNCMNGMLEERKKTNYLLETLIGVLQEHK